MRTRAARWLLRSRLAEHPGVYLPIARRKYPDAVLGDKTELVIDGFTRSAVTFATIAFQMGQPRPVRVAHTLHSAGHITAAARRGVPTLVTIRHPDETVLSAVVREPYVTLDVALVAYARFHAAIRRYRSGLVIGTFEEVTSDFGRVIDAVNERFRTRFHSFQHTEANVAECYGIIEDRARHPPWSRALGELECGIIGIEEYRQTVNRYRQRGKLPSLDVPEHRVQRPSAERAVLKRALREELESPRLDRLRARAREAYEALVSTPGDEVTR